MDDLEKAILISFDESGSVDSVLKSQAVAFCGQVKESPSICRLCIQRLGFSESVQVQFWCLQSLYDSLRDRYGSMPAEEKSFIRNSLFSMISYEGIQGETGVRVLDSPVFIKNKLAQVVVTLINLEYPVVWASVFLDFLPQLSKGVLVIDMFCRVLNSLDDEFISLDYPRSVEEYGAAARIKDAMRQQCIAQIIRACFDIVSMYRNSEPELCSNVLDTMRRYIPWIDIGLVANDAFTGLLFELLLLDGSSDLLRAASAKCILAMVSKQMDPKPKLSILQNLQIRRVFGLVTEDNDPDLVSVVASLVTGFATEALECHKRLNREDDQGIAVDLLNEAFPSVFYIMHPSIFNTMQNCEVDITFSITQFLSSYVGTMKNLPSLTESQQHHVDQILEGIRALIRYDPTYRNNCDVLDKVGKEEEERMGEFRKEFFVLLRSVGRVVPNVTHMFVRNSLASAVTSPIDRNVEEVEAALSLFYALGESVNDESLRTVSGILGDLVLMLLSTRFPCHSNRLVALVYLETIARYLKFVLESTQCIPLVLGAFLDERGIHHPNANVRQRASYLFMRVVKLLKGKLVPYMETILQSLQDTVAQFTTVSVALKPDSGSEDGSHIFEAIGLLIGLEEVPLEKQSKYLSALLSPLCQQVEVSLESAKTPSPSTIANIQQIVMAINALSKGFSERLITASRPAIGLMFKKTLDVLLQILVVFPKIAPLRSKVTSFIHRMVEILGTSVFPYLPKALEQLLTESQPKELAALLVLLNQLICKFSTAVHNILEEIYPVIVGRIFNVLPREDIIPSGPGGVTEEIRELQDLQRLFFTFLHVIATHGLSSVFLSLSSRGYLEPTMQLLLYTSCNHKEITVRKACVQIFIRLIKDWCTRPNGEETVPGFQNFVIESFAMHCCLYSVLNKSFDFRDANTLVLFGEIVLAQRIMFEKFGNNFLVQFVTKGFPTVHCPEELAEQYCHKVQADDVKALKSFYQSFIENLRQQQNGSMVFR